MKSKSLILVVILVLAIAFLPAFSTSSAATSVVVQAYSNGVSGNVSGISSSFPATVSSGDFVVVNVIYLSNTSNSISIITPQDSFGNSFSSITTPQQLSVSNDYFQSEWFAATSESTGQDNIISATSSSVAQICVSIFDLQNFYTFSVSGNVGLGSGASLTTGYYALPADSVSLVGSLAAVSSSLTYSVGSGYTQNSNAAAPCGGEHDYSTASISTDGPASLSSSSQSYFWFEQGITLESISTSSSTSSTSSTTITSISSSTSSSTDSTSTTTTSSTTSTSSKSTATSTITTTSTSTSSSSSSSTTSISTSTVTKPTIGLISIDATEPYIVQEVALASKPTQVFQITGGIVAQKVVGAAYKNYFYLFVNPSVTFNVNTSSESAAVVASGYSTSNVYWNIQTPPSSGTALNYATVGQDLDLGATSNTLSEWQWSNMNYVFSGSVSKISYTGSYDGGGPTACHVYSNNQERHSVYEEFIQTGTTKEYTIIGGELVQQNINGVQSTTFLVLVSTTHSASFESGDDIDCAEVLNPINSPNLRWYVRTPPVAGEISGATITGNFGITGTAGAELAPASTTNALVFMQFVNRTMQTGYIPNQVCATCVSTPSSTDPVSGDTANWPG